jgi:hypothetical protein
VFNELCRWIKAKAIQAQKRLDQGQNAWMLTDPHRVAEESIKEIYPGDIPQLRAVKRSAAREVFRWNTGKDRIVVVVTRAYWLSLYAASDSVIWYPTMVKEAACD